MFILLTRRIASTLLFFKSALFDHSENIRHVLDHDTGDIGDGIDVVLGRVAQGGAGHEGQVVEGGVQAFAGAGVEFGQGGLRCR